MVTLLLAIIYLAFISLGLPDALLGAAWPTMYEPFGVPLSYAGVIALIISSGTVVSSLQSDRLTKWLGTGRVTAISVAMTAFALFGFSISSEFWMLCLWAIPYGLGAGSVDASLNNYVALHYESRHMSWLHCMWGVGISVGPYIMGYALNNGMSWNSGYRYISIAQIVLTALIVFSLPLWKNRKGETEGTIKKRAVEEKTVSDKDEDDAAVNEGLKDKNTATLTEKNRTADKKKAKRERPLSIKEVLAIKGSKEIMFTFFCYCGLEQTVILWGSSYLVITCNVAEETAAKFASMFCIGITVGRLISGFLTIKFSDSTMIRMGQAIIATGVLSIFLPLGETFVIAGLILIGLGCAPIYPCVIHSTPVHFGAERSQAVIGVQMASAYVGVCVMPPLFGFIANNISMYLFPVYLILLLALMFFMHERLLRVSPGEK